MLLSRLTRCSVVLAATVLICAISLANAGCANQPPAQPTTPLNLSTPADAAMTFVRAIGQGDAASAKAASLGTEQQKYWVVALAGMIDGLRQVDRALLKHFGAAAERIDIDLRDALRPLAEHAEAEVSAATFPEQGDEASLVPAGHLLSIQVPYAVLLRRENGLWKVDLPAVYANKPQLATALNPSEMNILVKAGQELRQVAKEISAGKYKTLDAARSAINERMSRLSAMTR
jgi:hypothetical protein